MKCLSCGSISLIEGELINTSDGGSNAFKLSDISTWKSIFGMGTRKIKAYGCVNCNYLQFAVDFSEKDRERYLQFEGVQPSFLERIKTEEDEQK